MTPELAQALSATFGDRFTGSVIEPAHERELATLLRLLREHAEAPHGLRISRSRMSALGVIDPKSGTIEAGAGMVLERLEQELRIRDLSLGPLTPACARMEVAQFLEGPYAGLRVLPGGRCEPMALSLTALMPDGLRYVSRPSPRSSAGPDLDALFLGGEGRAGLIVQATLRCFPRPRSERSATWSFADVASLIASLRAGIAAGCWLRRVSMLSRGGRFLLAAEVIGSPEGVERDLSSLGQEVFAHGGRSSGHEVSLSPTAPLPAERELSWSDVAGLLSAGRALTLYRLSLESVIASGLEEGGVAMTSGGWANPGTLAAIIAEADPLGILGGVP